ncbi:MAG TPA: hypothetical protein VKI19_14075, partial [Acidimicrobiales bacterium]|nr:hypothetical protein [Acidimicrobiales bacterium]
IRLSGRLAGVGRNFAVVQRPGGHPVLFRAGAVEGLVPAGAPASAAAGGRRAPALDLSLADALDAMAAERLPVSVRTAAETWSGTVVAHGEDYLTLRSEGADRRVIHVADAAVVAVELR